MTQLERGAAIFDMLKLNYGHYHFDAQDRPIGKQEFRYKINGRDVCAAVFQASIGVSESVIARMRKCIKDNPGVTCAYDESDKAVAKLITKHGLPAFRETCYWISCVAWLINYAQITGDHWSTAPSVVSPYCRMWRLLQCSMNIKKS
jgi:hypothetical protein